MLTKDWSPLISLLFVITSFYSTIAQPIDFEEGNWEEVLQKAKETGKPIFVDTYATWCEPCKWMDEHVFKVPKVGHFFNEHYINYKLNIEKGEGKVFAETYRVAAYPTLLYFDTNGELVHRLIGVYNAEDLIQKSKQALDPDYQIYTLRKRYENGLREVNFLVQYTKALSQTQEAYTEVTAAFVQEVGLDKLIHAENFEYLECYIAKDYAAPAYRYVLEHRTAFSEALGANRIERYLEAPLKLRCFQLVDNGSNKPTIRAFLKEVKVLMPDRVDYFKSRIDFYANRGDERKQYRMALQYEKHCRDAESLASLARHTLQVYEDSPIQLNSALEWANRALLLETSLYTLETKTLILLALNRREEARTVAEQLLALSTSKNEYIQEAKALLDRITP